MAIFNIPRDFKKKNHGFCPYRNDGMSKLYLREVTEDVTIN
jgi:hypothetical protein